MTDFEDDDLEQQQQDSEGMIMGHGNGNTHIQRNFTNKINGNKKVGNFHIGLSGDRDVDDPMDDDGGDENLGGYNDEY